MKIINNILRVLLALLLVSPILGTLGVFPAPTADMYNTAAGWNFIQALYAVPYIMYVMAAVFAVAIGLIVTNRMALAALLILPITVNIIGFHAFLDGGLLTVGAIMANALALINIYFLWRSRGVYRILLARNG